MLGIFGGLFDPIHYGHLSAAWQMYQTLGLTTLRFIPCHHPPHRVEPAASATHRVNMIKLAIEQVPGFSIDERELKTTACSYTVHTLEAIRREEGNTPICLLLGKDAFAQLGSWKEPHRLIELAHIVVMDRYEPHAALSPFIKNLLKNQTQDKIKLTKAPTGLVYFAHNPQLAISSTLIRENFAHQQIPRFLLPDAVLSYIQENELY